jgi:hypothetical protein
LMHLFMMFPRRSAEKGESVEKKSSCH